MLYWFKKTRQPDPGTLAFAFEPRFTLPAFRGFHGSGLYAGSLSVLQPPQVIYLQKVPQSSVAAGGVISGQIFGQPLLKQ